MTLERQKGTSILNIFPARVLELSDKNGSQAVVRLDLGGSTILAKITRRSAELLSIREGQELFAQVKSVALNY